MRIPVTSDIKVDKEIHRKIIKCVLNSTKKTNLVCESGFTGKRLDSILIYEY